MPNQRLAPRRGLFAGLLALIAFASAAVGMTVGGGANNPTQQASTRQTIVLAADAGGGGDGDGDHGHHH